MLSGKTVLLGVTGGIACYKAAELASALVKQHCKVRVLMTKNATEFIAPLTFESLTGNPVAVDTFDRDRPWEIEHIALADQADLVLIAPATANVLAKLAHGLADDMLTTTVLACDCPKLAAPAMNTRMYENAVTQDNLDALRRYGWEIIEPVSGRLACGATGKGKLPDPERLLEAVLHALTHRKDMTGLKVLVTAGPTREALDPVRYLTNLSTGRMGYAVARAAAARGADVTLVTGPTELPRPPYMAEVVEVTSARQMFEAVTARSAEMDLIVKAAAVADYRPATVAENKIKKTRSGTDLSLPLERTDDILAWLGAHKRDGQVLCGFSMETADLLEHSREKLEKKRVDLIAANNLREEGAGFGTSTNLLTFLTADAVIPLPLMSKTEAAHQLLDELLRLMGM
ncbi:bifunctional phosphopantothenoylcysteine decarboxylase/phosphopantothenate--cysteine ligase CoaBC [Candidatus Pseudoscillospira sp. SGI.172]|uniref:bifunctional phosphopantothenoylcysteine decarboxylase/phosphopantothenate--cysteine ligase CoaBC n=1 Tax=Candidatus Pseudoscillospira sp. SGI.172 TaxID=3420582 RepID=UPI0009B944EC|nr:bifunctional phosphopantothenoylcysteine decarboxylase/phosphopantothenate--cysteine ligase CoaBC [Pseudoflavonifractor sp.]MDY3019532.1 bifunctional phosphopantothenoylcysteine decarboxylase/phosphopantothenate--cysteine ligase CoaBC [Oscillospiraceae bacterium]